MILIPVAMMCFVTGYILITITKMFPMFQMIYLDYIGGFFLFLPFLITMYFIVNEDMYLWVEKISKWRHRIAYMGRDNRVRPMTASRIYASESFMDNPKLGLIEFLGKDCVLDWGNKKMVWALENLNYTPDPRYASFTNLLYELGFSCPQDVVDVLNGDDLELMAKVWLNIQLWDSGHGVKKLVTDLKEYTGENFDFKERIKEENKLSIREKIDLKLGEVGYDKYSK